MKQKTTNRDAGYLHYESPSMSSLSVTLEGVLCQSESIMFDDTSLQDYEPGIGAW